VPARPKPLLQLDETEETGPGRISSLAICANEEWPSGRTNAAAARYEHRHFPSKSSNAGFAGVAFNGNQVRSEEIPGRDQFPVLRQELFPDGLPAPFRRRLNAMSMKNMCDRAASNVVPEVEKGTLGRR
jgi:hypothetical protein